MQIVLTQHAHEAAARRQIDEDLIRRMAERPAQRLSLSTGEVVFQAKYFDSIRGKMMLLRIVAQETPGQVRVLTVYKTSRIEKYWKAEGEPQ